LLLYKRPSDKVRPSASVEAGIPWVGNNLARGRYISICPDMQEVVFLDRDRGLVTVESGIQWPELIDWLLEKQAGKKKQWGIRQKQTGADRLSIGGALSSNVHGRGLTLGPIIEDVESFELVGGDGQLILCNRKQNSELFRLVIGGYGLFGVITEVALRLSPRTKLERKVEIVKLNDVPSLVKSRIQNGYLFKMAISTVMLFARAYCCR